MIMYYFKTDFRKQGWFFERNPSLDTLLQSIRKWMRIAAKSAKWAIRRAKNGSTFSWWWRIKIETEGNDGKLMIICRDEAMYLDLYLTTFYALFVSLASSFSLPFALFLLAISSEPSLSTLMRHAYSSSVSEPGNLHVWGIPDFPVGDSLKPCDSFDTIRVYRTDLCFTLLLLGGPYWYAYSKDTDNALHCNFKRVNEMKGPPPLLHPDGHIWTNCVNRIVGDRSLNVEGSEWSGRGQRCVRVCRMPNLIDGHKRMGNRWY